MRGKLVVLAAMFGFVASAIVTFCVLWHFRGDLIFDPVVFIPYTIFVIAPATIIGTLFCAGMAYLVS